MEKEKFDTCKHVKRVGNFAVHVKPTCKQATMIRGQLVVSKARCLKCRCDDMDSYEYAEECEEYKTGRRR